MLTTKKLPNVNVYQSQIDKFQFSIMLNVNFKWKSKHIEYRLHVN